MEMINNYTELIKKQGEGVGLNTYQCKNWKKEHKNCKGCITELGCSKVVCLGLLTLSGISPLEDHLDRILRAKTPEELLDIDLEPVPYSDCWS